MRLDRSPYVIEFDEQFSGETLNENHWVPHYTPQWSSREASRARYTVGGGMLRLRIDEDQPPWSPEYDGDLRVSNLQTGVRSGAVGTPDGQGRFRPDLVVREHQAARKLYTPQYGLVEARVRATSDPRCMVALWMIGFEEFPEDSGELCVFEIFGHEVGPISALVGMGIHPHHDPRLREDFHKVPVPVDVTEFHTYSAEWSPEGTRLYVDDALVLTLDQAPAYELQLMLDIYEFPAEGEYAPVDGDERPYPKEFVVDFVRGYRPAG